MVRYFGATAYSAVFPKMGFKSVQGFLANRGLYTALQFNKGFIS